MQVPERYMELYTHLQHKENEARRKMMAMITALDDAVGEIVQNLKSKGLFDDTFFLFTSDVSNLHQSFNLHVCQFWYIPPLRRDLEKCWLESSDIPHLFRWNAQISKM